MKKLIWFVFCSLLIYATTATAAEKITFIRLVSEEWEGATNKDGTGFYWDITRAVYEPIDIKVQCQVVPYARGVSDVLTGKADAWVGSYANETEFAVYPVHAFDADNVAALFKSGQFDKTLGKSILKHRNVGWIRGYEYDRYLGIDETEYLLNTRKSGILMVANDRLDFYIDARYEIDTELEKSYVDPGSMDVLDIATLEIFMAFSPNFKGRHLRDIWDRRMEELEASGELRALYKKYESYTSFYPFPQ